MKTQQTETEPTRYRMATREEVEEASKLLRTAQTLFSRPDEQSDYDLLIGLADWVTGNWSLEAVAVEHLLNKIILKKRESEHVQAEEDKQNT